jgi:hypothetical protein
MNSSSVPNDINALLTGKLLVLHGCIYLVGRHVLGKNENA